MSLDLLRREIGVVNDLLCAASILVWDSRTMMPAGGVEARGHQIATLTEAARERLLSPATRRALDAAETEVQGRSEEHTSELQSRQYLVCRLLLDKKRKENSTTTH